MPASCQLHRRPVPCAACRAEVTTRLLTAEIEGRRSRGTLRDIRRLAGVRNAPTGRPTPTRSAPTSVSHLPATREVALQLAYRTPEGRRELAARLPPSAPERPLGEVVFRAPWAILPAAMQEVVRLATAHLEGATNLVRSSGGVEARDQRGVAVIPIHGVLMQRPGLLASLLGATATESLLRPFRLAMADETVSAIVLDIDSPGGEVSGIPELAAEIRAARGIKPIVAVADTLAASAAYWLAAQADEVVASPSAELGSIGVLWAYTDRSGAEAKAGRTTELVTAGRYKGETSGLGPLTAEARAHAQGQVDAMYGLFVADVARGRGASEASVRAGYGEGRTYLAEQAVRTRLADRVDTLDGVVGRLARRGVTPSHHQRG